MDDLLLAANARIERSRESGEPGDDRCDQLLQEASPTEIVDRPVIAERTDLKQGIWVDNARLANSLKEWNIVMAI